MSKLDNSLIEIGLKITYLFVEAVLVIQFYCIDLLNHILLEISIDVYYMAVELPIRGLYVNCVRGRHCGGCLLHNLVHIVDGVVEVATVATICATVAYVIFQ